MNQLKHKYNLNLVRYYKIRSEYLEQMLDLGDAKPEKKEILDDAVIDCSKILNALGRENYKEEDALFGFDVEVKQ